MADVKLQEIYYVAGPMRGMAQFNYPAFAAAAAHARIHGYRVVSPHEINADADPDNQEDGKRSIYVRRALFHLLGCTGILVLPMWFASAGASLEVRIGIALDMSVRWADTFDELPRSDVLKLLERNDAASHE